MRYWNCFLWKICISIWIVKKSDVDTTKFRPWEYLESLACEHGFDPQSEEYDVDLLWRRLQEEAPDEDGASFRELAEQITAERYRQDRDAILDKHYLIFNLYMYDHSGIALSLSSFNDPWDSGQVGFIIVSRADLEKEFNIPKDRELTQEEYDLVCEIINNEINMYEAYINGCVYGYVVEDPAGEIVDSCGGFYSIEEALEYAMVEIDGMIKQENERIDYTI